MKVTVAVNTQVISKEDYVQELTTSGIGDVERSLTVTTDTTPETIEVEVDNEQEFDSILNSNKVAGAQSDRLKLDHRTQGTRSITPNTTSTTDITHHNWGLAAMTQNSTTYASSFTYQDTGSNVDCVIMDTGIVLNHPEFNDASNVSTRIQQINWGGTQGGSFYTDSNGHGTHCAGIMAGRTQGWASGSDIYVFTTNLGSVNYGYNASQMGYITTWHQGKGNGKPTVVNMSWGTSTYYPPNHPSHFISTGSWDPNSIPNSQYHMTRSQTYDTIIQNMVNAGIVVVCSAGNDNERVYDSTESGWNSGYWYFFDSGNDMGYGVNEKIYKEDASAYDPNVYGTGPRTGIAGATPAGSFGNTIYFQATNNGQSPSNAWIENGTTTRHDISVQAHQSNKSKSSYSNYGTPLRTWAPGDYIMSSYINSGSAVQLGSTGYYYNKLNGTSMASPQIAGMLALMLEKDHTTYGAVTTKANQETAISFIENNDRTNDITDWGDGLTNLHRAYMPYQDYTRTWSIGQGSSNFDTGTYDTGDSYNKDFSVTYRNAASEQLHTVSYNITSGSLPTGVTMDSSGSTSGNIENQSVGADANISFTLSTTNSFQTETKDYYLTVNGSNGIVITAVNFNGVTIS